MAVLQPVRDALQQVNKRAWLLGDRMAITRKSKKSPEVPCWSDGSGYFFEITKFSNHEARRLFDIALIAI